MIGDARGSLRWMGPDALARLVPFAALVAIVELRWRPTWLGVGPGELGLQLAVGVVGAGALFACAAAIRSWIAHRGGNAVLPGGRADLALQLGYFLVNAPLEEAFFRGLLQGGGGQLISPLAAGVIATLAYSLYHRLGGWRWPEVGATLLAGIPLALIFRLLPGPPSLLAVSIAHFGATCGFLGPGVAVLRRLRRL